jgi:CHAT domain-containing protein
LTESGGGESISGMARAFFAAGAKSVLATQWAVESESAKQLVVNSLAAYGNVDGSIGKAQALALAQRDMASGKNGALYQHPFFWAAYFVMGEPHR